MIIFIDIDGTLYDGNGVPDSAWAAIRQVQAAGHRVVLSTGRPAAGLAFDTFAQAVDPEGPHIFDAGATIRWADGRPERAMTLAPAVVQQVAELAAQGDERTLEIYTADGGFFGLPLSEGVLEHGRLLGFAPSLWTGDTDGVVRAQILVGRADWAQLRPSLEALPDTALHVGISPGMPHHVFAGLTRPGVSKASAGAHVAALFGVPLDRCAMIGDGDNDIEIMRAVGFGVAMGDSTPGLAAVADVQVGPPEHHGLRDALELLLDRAEKGE